MSDNVQGFNHLDEILLHLGDQFRQDAIKQAMLKNMAERNKIAGQRLLSGKFNNVQPQQRLALLKAMQADSDKAQQQSMSMHRDYLRGTVDQDAVNKDMAQWDQANGQDLQELMTMVKADQGFNRAPSSGPAPKTTAPNDLPINLPGFMSPNL